jgi:beta-phosphoglucomutase-like phosphatase (HAD superfamily)
MAAERLGVTPERLLAVEDSESGVASARAAGLRTAAIGGQTAGRVDWLIDSLTKVVDIVLSQVCAASGATNT